jgi:hypothetical protein
LALTVLHDNLEQVNAGTGDLMRHRTCFSLRPGLARRRSDEVGRVVIAPEVDDRVTGTRREEGTSKEDARSFDLSRIDLAAKLAEDAWIAAEILHRRHPSIEKLFERPTVVLFLDGQVDVTIDQPRQQSLAPEIDHSKVGWNGRV